MVEQRGECKTPGGKLVSVSLACNENLILSATLSGDFFIHPEARARSVLDLMAKVLITLPTSINQEKLAQKLADVLPWDVELIGTSPQAIAVAIRRALGDAHAQLSDPAHPQDHLILSDTELEHHLTAWKTVPWRVIPEQSFTPALNVALDEVLCNGVAIGQRPATLRFWRWSSQAVILGRCQSVMNEVDQDSAETQGISIVRRMTGGGAMFLQPHGAITYSLYLPEHLLSGARLRHSYQICEAWVISCLRHLGVDAFHAPINDIACSMGKIGGAAQARRQGVILHHTTMAYEMDPGEMVRVLRIGREKLSDKPAVASAAKRVSPLARQTGLSREAIVAALQQSFFDRMGGTLDELTQEEMNAAHALVSTKYGHPSWTFEIA